MMKPRTTSCTANTAVPASAINGGKLYDGNLRRVLQGGEHAGRFVARKFQRGDARDRAAEQSPHEQFPNAAQQQKQETRSASDRRRTSE